MKKFAVIFMLCLLSLSAFADDFKLRKAQFNFNMKEQSLMVKGSFKSLTGMIRITDDDLKTTQGYVDVEVASLYTYSYHKSKTEQNEAVDQRLKGWFALPGKPSPKEAYQNKVGRFNLMTVEKVEQKTDQKWIVDVVGALQLHNVQKNLSLKLVVTKNALGYLVKNYEPLYLQLADFNLPDPKVGSTTATRIKADFILGFEK